MIIISVSYSSYVSSDTTSIRSLLCFQHLGLASCYKPSQIHFMLKMDLPITHLIGTKTGDDKTILKVIILDPGPVVK